MGAAGVPEARVAARGVGHDEDGGAGREVDPADGGGHPRQLERALQGRLGAQLSAANAP